MSFYREKLLYIFLVKISEILLKKTYKKIGKRYISTGKTCKSKVYLLRFNK